MPVYKRGCVRVGTFRNSTHVQMGYVTNTRLLDASSTWACDIYGGSVSVFHASLYICCGAIAGFYRLLFGHTCLPNVCMYGSF
jgi:hypothetical protein